MQLDGLIKTTRGCHRRCHQSSKSSALWQQSKYDQIEFYYYTICKCKDIKILTNMKQQNDEVPLGATFEQIGIMI